MNSLWFKDYGQMAWGAKEDMPRRLEPEAVKKGLETGSLSDRYCLAWSSVER